MQTKSCNIFSGVSSWRRSVRDAFLKLDPREQRRNAVMFIVWIGAALVTCAVLRRATAFGVQIALWLWFTVLFANWAEALAEGRGKAQADALRKARGKTVARRVRGGGVETVPAADLRAGDMAVCEAGNMVDLDSGADDYLTKPFHVDELLARLRVFGATCRPNRMRRFSSRRLCASILSSGKWWCAARKSI